LAGFDQLGQAMSGSEYELGGEGNPPVWYRFGMCDQACASQSAIAVALALYWRERTGHGQFVDTSIITVGCSSTPMCGSAPTDRSYGPASTPIRRPRPAVRLYRTSDGWIAIACLNEAHWKALRSCCPRPATTVRPRSGRAHRRCARHRHGGGWFSRLDTAGVPVEISDESAGRTWLSDPDLIAAGLVASYEHPTTAPCNSSAISSSCRTLRAGSPDRHRVWESTASRSSPTSVLPRRDR